MQFLRQEKPWQEGHLKSEQHLNTNMCLGEFCNILGLTKQKLIISYLSTRNREIDVTFQGTLKAH